MVLINHNAIMKAYYIDKKKIIKHITDIICCYYKFKIKDIRLCDYLLFVPLPSKLKIQNLNIISIDNKYFSTKNNNYIIPADICLPHYSISPIPFSFPYCTQSKIGKSSDILSDIQLIKSNVYYYEITIDSIPATTAWDSMNIGIGFGTTNTDTTDNILGWTNETIGYNSFNGGIYGWSLKEYVFKEYGLGDTVGAGIIYNTANNYTIFFTLNGTIFSEMLKINTCNKIIPMIGLNYNAMIKINFNKEKFKYNYRKHILPIVITTNNSFIKSGYVDSMYQFNQESVSLPFE